MKHPRSSLLGAVAGLMAGVLLTSTPLTARRSTTHLTWDGSTCPAGSYTITSTATNVATSQTYVASLSNVVLPRGTVGLDFANLPTGSYSVVASLQSDGGLSFSSEPQTIAAQNGKSAPAAPTVNAASAGRRRPGSAPIIGVAQPRETPPPPIGYAAGSRGTAVATIAPDPGQAPKTELSAHAVLLESLLRMFAASDVTAKLVQPDSVRTLDIDGDGIADFVVVTIAGEVTIWRIPRS
jgi:hypothetical protein